VGWWVRWQAAGSRQRVAGAQWRGTTVAAKIDKLEITIVICKIRYVPEDKPEVWPWVGGHAVTTAMLPLYSTLQCEPNGI